MKINGVTYARTYNLGNYEKEEYTVEATIEGKETIAATIAQLKQEVQAAHCGAPAEPSEEVEEEIEEEVAEEVEEEIEETELGNDLDEEDTDQSDDSEEEEEPVRKAGKKKTASTPGKTAPSKSTKKPKAKFKAKAQVYTRTNDTHKVLFSKTMLAASPNWKSSEKSIARAKEVSKKMEGVEMIDENGEVFASFKEQVRKLMTPAKKK